MPHLIALLFFASLLSAAQRPNVILINVDDQGYGDLGCTGNPVIQTPHIDQLYNESVRFTDYHVNAVCAPSRAALMAGQNAAKVGVWHTLGGNEIVRADVTLMPEYFQRAGYATMMVGKWHIGDNYPYRPEDRGFDYVYRIGGGNPGQVPDYWGNGIFDTHYWDGKQWLGSQGFCTDAQFDRSMEFIGEHEGQPFFLYLATTAVHSPVGAPDEYYALYPQLEGKVQAFYAMVSNLDTNIGRLREFLKGAGLSENTILVFTTDNGSACDKKSEYDTYNANMRGKKGSTYDGGHRVPLFVHWPKGGMGSAEDIDALVAHYDLLPTFAEACELPIPEDSDLDGSSLLRLLENDSSAFDNRVVVVEAKVNKRDVRYDSSAIMKGPWRLTNGTKELYHIQRDPSQADNIAKQHPEIVQSLKDAYDSWYDAISPRFAEEARIIIGDANAPRDLLNSMDVRDRMGAGAGKQIWNQKGVATGLMYHGVWKLEVAQSGSYTFKLRRYPPESGLNFSSVPHKAKKVVYTEAQLRVREHDLSRPVDMSLESVDFTVELEAGPVDLDANFTNDKGQTTSAYYVEVALN